MRIVKKCKIFSPVRLFYRLTLQGNIVDAGSWVSVFEFLTEREESLSFRDADVDKKQVDTSSINQLQVLDSPQNIDAVQFLQFCPSNGSYL